MSLVMSITSTFFQLVYVVRMSQAFYKIILMIRDTNFAGSGDPKLLAGAISHALMIWILGAVVGLVGVGFAWRVLREKESRPDWFVSASRLFAFAWMLFIPVGTLVGFFMLRWTNMGRGARVLK